MTQPSRDSDRYPIEPDVLRLVAGVAKVNGVLPLRLGRALLETLAKAEVPGGPVDERIVTRLAGGDIPLQIFRPRGDRAAAGTSRPTILLVHGGGWALGGFTSYAALARLMADETNAVVVSVGYRLAPEHRFPAALDDVRAALAWVRAHVGDLGADPTRIALAGDSAGGNLAAVLALDPTKGPPLAAQLLLYPETDARGAYGDPAIDARYPSRAVNADAPVLSTAMMRRFALAYVNDVALLDLPSISPIVADVAISPPTYLVTAQFDPLRDEGEAYRAKLAAAGVDVRGFLAEGTVHAFASFASRSASCDALTRRVLREFAAMLAPRAAAAPSASVDHEPELGETGTPPHASAFDAREGIGRSESSATVAAALTARIQAQSRATSETRPDAQPEAVGKPPAPPTDAAPAPDSPLADGTTAEIPVATLIAEETSALPDAHSAETD